MAISPAREKIRFVARDYGVFLLNGLVGIALMGTFFQASVLVVGTAATCAVVFSANPLFVVIFARFINAEPWNMAKGLAVGLGLLGVTCFAWEAGVPTLKSFFGLLLVLLAAVFFAISICFSRRVVARYGALRLLGFSALFGSIMLLPPTIFILWKTGCSGIWETRWLVTYHALVGTVLAYGLYYWGLAKTSAYRASLSFFLKPVLASFLAALLLGERINAYMIVGTTFIISGLALAVLQKYIRIPGLSPRATSGG